MALVVVIAGMAFRLNGVLGVVMVWREVTVAAGA